MGMCSLRSKSLFLGDGLVRPMFASPMQSLRCPASPGFKLHKYPCRPSYDWSLGNSAPQRHHDIASAAEPRSVSYTTCSVHYTGAGIRAARVSHVGPSVRLLLQATRGGESSSAPCPSPRPTTGERSRRPRSQHQDGRFRWIGTGRVCRSHRAPGVDRHPHRAWPPCGSSPPDGKAPLMFRIHI